ncbi:MAG TPA: tyrosine-type recombinase/integrase [Anaerolineales bacterium]|nr:tyrosine-type recombinase/integrase [Anaerolineales bacterium]
MRNDIERFIQWVRIRSPQARTWQDYRCDLYVFLNVIGDQNIEDTRVRDVDKFVNHQVTRGYKPSTINRRLAALSSFYAFMLDEGRNLSSPVLPKRHYLKEPKRLPRPVNEKDLRRFFNVIDDIRDRAMCTLMLRCGLRIGEVSALKMSDLFLGDSPSRMIIRGKGARERTVYLSPQAEHDLNNWLAIRPNIPCEQVFVSYQQKKISTTSISKRIKHLRELSGVSLTAHRLRHTFADNLLSAGMSITSIQKLMGHRFIETTQNYAIANDKQVQKDFYSATQKIEGWKLLIDAVQANSPGEEAQMDQFVDLDLADDEPDQKTADFEIPASAYCLNDELVWQLEAYRQMMSNRWRSERVEPNSRHFFSMQIAVWKYFQEIHSVYRVIDLRLEHVMQYVSYRLETGRSPKTVNGNLSALRSFLIFLKEDGIEVHPSLENIRRLKESGSLPRYMTSEQVQRLQSEIEADVTWQSSYDAFLIRSIFYLLWQGGMRTGEVEQLRFSDFYISEKNDAKRLFVRDGKWRRGRVVYLTDAVLNALKAYLAVRGMDRIGGYVFVREGFPLGSGFICNRLKAIGKRVYVPVVPHRLRHTFATQLLNVGCRVTTIQKLFGHASVDTTMTYARAFDQTVMLDYYSAINELETQVEGAWHGMNIEK